MFSIISLVAFLHGLIYRLCNFSRSSTKSTAPTRICVFCAASSGTDPVHLAAARSLAQIMHANNIHLIYGGGTTGMMGEVAKTLVKLSGQTSVHGIIPKALLSLERPGGSKEYAEEFGDITVVKDLQTRKMKMMELVRYGAKGSGFVGLSGGFGTMDEVMEVVSWRQHGVHGCGTVLFNVNGYWDGIMTWMERGITDGFVKAKARDYLTQKGDAEGVVEWLKEVAGK